MESSNNFDVGVLENISTAFFLGFEQLLKGGYLSSEGGLRNEQNLPESTEEEEEDLAYRTKSPLNPWTRTGGLAHQMMTTLNESLATTSLTQPSSWQKSPTTSAPTTSRASTPSIEPDVLGNALVLDPAFESTLGIPAVLSKRQREILKKKNRPNTAGSDWFHLPAQEMTPELKQELQILYLRPYIYKDRFYKKIGGPGNLPKHFQVGRVVAGAAEKYRSLSKKESNKSFVDQTLEDSKVRNWTKKKFLEVQAITNPQRKPKYQKFKRQRT